jgi:hypothetical protein
MATKFVTNLDLNQNQLLKARFQTLSSDPSSDLFEGWVYYNTTSDTLRIYANGVWRTFLDGISAAGSASTALTVNESGGLVTLTPNLATSSAAGVMSSTDKAKLDDATSEATASKLVIRDGSGQAKFGTPTDDAHAARQLRPISKNLSMRKTKVEGQKNVRLKTGRNQTQSGTKAAM